jgi:hypothetical protein
MSDMISLGFEISCPCDLTLIKSLMQTLSHFYSKSLEVNNLTMDVKQH